MSDYLNDGTISTGGYRHTYKRRRGHTRKAGVGTSQKYSRRHVRTTMKMVGGAVPRPKPQTTKPLTSCPTGKKLQGGKCVAITCPAGKKLQGSACVAITCPAGQKLQGSTCQAIKCATGQELKGSTCVKKVCAAGTQLKGNICEKIQCKPGEELKGSKCVKKVCAAGTKLKGNICEKIQCPAGQKLQGSTCKPDPTASCPAGQYHDGTKCIKGEPKPGGKCATTAGCPKGQKCTNKKCVPDPTAACPAGQYNNGTQCIKGEPVAGGKCSTSAGCPKGQKCTKGKCVPDPTAKCPTGKHHDGTQCVDGDAPTDKCTTPPKTELVAGKCMPPCPTGLKYVGNTCKTDPKAQCSDGEIKHPSKGCIPTPPESGGLAVVPNIATTLGVTPPIPAFPGQFNIPGSDPAFQANLNGFGSALQSLKFENEDVFGNPR